MKRAVRLPNSSMARIGIKAKPSGCSLTVAALTPFLQPCSSEIRPTAREWPLLTSGSGMKWKTQKGKRGTYFFNQGGSVLLVRWWVPIAFPLTAVAAFGSKSLRCRTLNACVF